MAAPYRIRPATVDDVGFLTDVPIAATCAQGRLPADFDEVEWRAGYAEWTIETLAHTSVIELYGERVGRLRISRTPESIELSGIQLLPEVQNRGIGTAIITDLQAEAATLAVPLDLGVEKDNTNARRLYDRLGFRMVGESGDEDKLRWTDRKGG
jgi:ribosomal protein S18 acetylase RimI-like enzyme